MRRFFVEGIALSICSAMCCFQASDGKVTIEDLAHQAQSLLDIQGVNRNPPQKKTVNEPNLL